MPEITSNKPVEPIAKWRAGDSSVTRLPRGNHRISREDVLASQRGRILRATLEALGEQGHAALSVSEIVRRAKISRKAFYQQFDSFDACLAEGMMTTNLIMGAEMAAAVEASTDTGPFSQIRAAVTEFMSMAADEPSIAVAVVGNSYALESATKQVWLDVLVARKAILNAFWEAERKRDRSLPATTPELLAAASKTIETTILEAIARDEADQLSARADATADAVISILGG